MPVADLQPVRVTNRESSGVDQTGAEAEELSTVVVLCFVKLLSDSTTW